MLMDSQRHYAKGSPDRLALEAALQKFEREIPVKIPAVVGGKEVSITPGTTNWMLILLRSNHKQS